MLNKNQLSYINLELDVFHPSLLSAIHNENAPKLFVNDNAELENFQLSAEKRAKLVQFLSEKGDEIDQNLGTELLNENVFTVTTGHQLSFLGGPLFFFLKIAHAIQWAKTFNAKNSVKRVIPVFWMASEDHDLEEVFEPLWNGVAAPKFDLEPDLMAGKFTWSAQRLRILKDWAKENGLQEGLLDCFAEGDSQAQVTRKVVRMFFPNEDLIILDPNDPALKLQCLSLWERDVCTNDFREAGAASEARYKSLSWKPQIGFQDFNTFYIKDQFRVKVSGYKEGVLFLADGTHVQESDIDWSCFSPNVVLRPLYQQSILPNLAYIGGGAEMVYWDQLKEVFEVAELAFPHCVMRNMALQISESDADLWLANGLNELDLTRPWKVVERNWLLAKTKEQRKRLLEFEALQKEKLKTLLEDLFPNQFDAYKMGEEKELEKRTHRLVRKVVKSTRLDNAKLLAQLERVHQSVRRVGVLAERKAHPFEFPSILDGWPFSKDGFQSHLIVSKTPNK